MRISILALLLLPSAFALAGKLPPLTMKDLSLMLRTGYSGAAVEKEVFARHIADSPDAAMEKTLLQAGATPEFIGSLRSGMYAVSPEEMAAEKKESALREERRKNALAAATRRESQPATSAVAAKPTPNIGPHKLVESIHSNLVVSRDGILQPFDNQSLEKKKFIALYFSAHWCPPCRKFTPQLVQYYNRVVATHPEVEIIFVSKDRSSSAMEGYMRDMQMPWPALPYESADKESLARFAGNGIPCLVLIDANGQVVSNSYEGKTYLGPEKVLADLDQLLGEKSQVALQR